jgi:hypothetical protein
MSGEWRVVCRLLYVLRGERCDFFLSFFFLTLLYRALEKAKKERSQSAAAVGAGFSRFSLSAAYNRRSLPGSKNAGGLSSSNHGNNGNNGNNGHADSTEGDEDFDVSGMDMFTRNSVAIFERLNQEQVSEKRCRDRSYLEIQMRC